MTDLHAYSAPRPDRRDEDMSHAFIHRGVFWALEAGPLPERTDWTERTLAEYEAALDAAKADGMRRGFPDHREGVPTIPRRFSDDVRDFLTDVGTDVARVLPR